MEVSLLPPCPHGSNLAREERGSKVPLTISGTVPGEGPYGIFRPGLCIAIPDGTILEMTCVWPHELSKS